jgi:hypothetical protein
MGAIGECAESSGTRESRAAAAAPIKLIFQNNKLLILKLIDRCKACSE